MAHGLNKVMIIGRLGRDPEMRFTPNGKPVTGFSMACNREWKDFDGKTYISTEWFNIVIWGGLAEFAKQSLTHGSMVYVEGRLQSRTWHDNDGNMHKSIEIIAQDLILLSDKKDDQTSVNKPEDTEKNPFTING